MVASGSSPGIHSPATSGKSCPLSWSQLVPCRYDLSQNKQVLGRCGIPLHSKATDAQEGTEEGKTPGHWVACVCFQLLGIELRVLHILAKHLH